MQHIAKTILLWTLLLQVSFYSNASAQYQEDDAIRYRKLFEHVLSRIKTSYIKDMSDAQLIEKALDGMLMSLDPYCAYLNQSAFENFKILSSGEFGGLGIEITMEDGLIKIISPYEDSPAERSGLVAGDYITKIDGKIVRGGMSISDAVSKLRGNPGSIAQLEIYRKQKDKSFNLSIKREFIKIKPVKSKIIGRNHDIIYIKLSNTFNSKVSLEVEKKYNKLYHMISKKKEDGPLGVVLDLRSNPGGLLEQAVSVSELFLEDQQEIVSTKGRAPGSNITYFAKNTTGIARGLPLVVLVNEGSASASEIVAGALQDNKRALVVGVTSFGKGSVQNVIEIPGYGGMKITTAHYYTPSGRIIEGKGIVPDIEVGNNNSAKKDVQLTRAVDIITGLKLYNEINKG